MKGIVLNFDTKRGIGTILGEDGKHYFLHFKSIKTAYKVLSKKEHVEFDVRKVNEPGKNDQAINITSTDITDPRVFVHNNPFKLRPINKPEYFAGRRNIIIEGVNALLNHNNVLLTGIRGMGKSSLANQFYYIAQGNNFLMNKLEIQLGKAKTLNYGVIAIRAFKESSIGDIAGNIVREFIKKYQLDKKEEIQHEIDLKIYKLKMKTLTTDMAMDNLVDLFNYDIIRIHDHLKFKDGLLILVDEVENIDPDTGFANFVKNVTEYFDTEERNIIFVLSGIPCAMTERFCQHPSFFRLFTPIEVTELSIIESYELIDLCMKGQSKLIDNKAKTTICNSSRGYPVNLQLMGFYSYQNDNDGMIVEEDVRSAITHIVDNIKKREFESKHEAIGHGLAEAILKYTVVEKKGQVEFLELQNHFGKASETDITDAINTLLEQEVLYRERKGLYFVRDHLFYSYLRKYYR